MPLLNRFLTSIVAICGMSTIIGSGFCVWTFVGDDNEIVNNVEANIEVTSSVNAGQLRLLGNLEAQIEVKENNENATDEDNWDDIKTVDGISLNDLINMYTSRKIVFTEGNEDSNSLKDGLTFYRFQRDKELGIRTYIRENEVRGGFAFVPKDEYEILSNAGYLYKIGLRVSMPTGTNSISEYLEVDSRYNADDASNPSFSIYQNNEYVNFLDLTNTFFEYKDITDEVLKYSYIEDFSDCYAFNFKLNLQDMFSYKSGKKPNSSEKLKAIKNAISNNFEGWQITFDFVTTYIN